MTSRNRSKNGNHVKQVTMEELPAPKDLYHDNQDNKTIEYSSNDNGTIVKVNPNRIQIIDEFPTF